MDTCQTCKKPITAGQKAHLVTATLRAHKVCPPAVRSGWSNAARRRSGYTSRGPASDYAFAGDEARYDEY